MLKISLFIASITLLTSCNQNKDLGIFIKIVKFETQCKIGGEPNLHVNSRNDVFLTWIEYQNDSIDALMFSELEEHKWTEARLIASGSDWFVNWADFPSLSSYESSSENLAAHWLQKSAGGTYDYDIRISQSRDRGVTWDSSFVIHQDKIAAEHGFLSLITAPNNRLFASWLDGRNTLSHQSNSVQSGHTHHGAMTLRTAEIKLNGEVLEEAELDDKVCDCCQTDAAMTDLGPVVVYRDRSESEVRDISIVRKVNGKWTVPQVIYHDNWTLAGCPVNGPAIASMGSNLAVAWYTISNGDAKVKLAFSDNFGATFDSPIIIDDSDPLGRIDLILLEKGEAVISWLDQKDDEAVIKLSHVHFSGKISSTIELAQTSTSRNSGFPRMVKTQNEIIVAWTNVDSLTGINTARIEY